jgi:hypothetical protein
LDRSGDSPNARGQNRIHAFEMTLRWPLFIAFLVGCNTHEPTSQAPRQAPSEDRPPSQEPVVAQDPPVPPPPPPPPLGTCTGPAGQTVRTLIVGNSQIYFWDLPRLVTELSATAPPECPRIAADGFTRGGQNLERLWNHGDSEGRNLEVTIREGKYDVVVIAESIDLIELPPPMTRFVTFANRVIDAARASGAKPILYATPYADQHGHRGFLEMAEPQLELAAARDVPVAAGGLAWLRVWQELPEIDLHHPDHAHPGYKGSIVSAMVIYAVITRGTPLALTPTQTDCEPRPGEHEACPAITPTELDVFRRAAWAEATATGIR